MAATTSPTATLRAAFSPSPSPCSHAARSPASVAPPKAPARTPTSVIPICTLERKRPWFSSSRKAARAPLLPASAMAVRRGRREDTTASSAMAK